MGKVLRLYGIGRVFESRGGIITLLPAGLRGIAFTQRSKNATRCPDKREIWHLQKCGNTAPKTVKISYFGQKFVLLQGRLVCNIFTKFSVFVRVYRYTVPFKFLFGHFRGTNTQVISIFPR